MNIKEVYGNLCFYDKRNPYYIKGENKKTPCYCDNCFYKRHDLAIEILRLKELEENQLDICNDLIDMGYN